uniref:Uncharacterized protein n=1 Tax=Clostridium botulinum TaxID=1491 RepID=C4IXR5_CLOBO|nr:hypothetical protein [Clostridium botulinum]
MYFFVCKHAFISFNFLHLNVLYFFIIFYITIVLLISTKFNNKDYIFIIKILKNSKILQIKLTFIF